MSLLHTRIEIPGTTNLRDLGGLPAGDGRVVAPGMLYRSEALALPGASEVHAIWSDMLADHYSALGVRTVIDLRSEGEVAATPTAWDRATGVEVTAVPIAEGGEGSNTNYMGMLLRGELAGFSADDMAAFYCETVVRRAAEFGAAVKLLADPTRLPALAHCSAGKDRTGMLIALVLTVLGTPREVIVEDYALTGILRPNRVEAYAEVFAAADIELDDVRALFESPASAMELLLDFLDDAHGGAEGLLITLGDVRAADLDALRDNLLIKPSSE